MSFRPTLSRSYLVQREVHSMFFFSNGKFWELAEAFDKEDNAIAYAELLRKDDPRRSATGRYRIAERTVTETPIHWFETEETE